MAILPTTISADGRDRRIPLFLSTLGRSIQCGEVPALVLSRSVLVDRSDCIEEVVVGNDTRPSPFCNRSILLIGCTIVKE